MQHKTHNNNKLLLENVVVLLGALAVFRSQNVTSKKKIKKISILPESFLQKRGSLLDEHRVGWRSKDKTKTSYFEDIYIFLLNLMDAFVNVSNTVYNNTF